MENYNSEFIINTRNLTKNFGNTTALNNVSVDIPKGKIIGLLGPNGSGKTTLIKIITGLLMKYEGTVLIDGNMPGPLSKSKVAYLPDCNFLEEAWTVNDAIVYFKDFFADFDESKALNLFAKLGIITSSKIKNLSKGNKEKVHLILILSRNADLYIFDEPIAGVDPAARDLIFQLILENYNKNGSVIMSTHLISDAEPILDYALFLKEGSLALFDTVENIKNTNNKTLDELFREMYRYA